MITLSYNVRISRQEGYTPLQPLFDFDTQPSASTQPPMWESILATTSADSTSPVVEYGLSFEDLHQRVVTPFGSRHDIRLDGRTISFGAMERIEIKADGTATDLSLYSRMVISRLGLFEWNGTDVTKEFIQDPPAWGPRIGAPERPEAIPVNLLFDRLVTNELLRKVTQSRFRSRHFADALEAACKCLENAVKDKAGLPDKFGEDLMFAAFNEDKPILRLNQLRSKTDINEQKGYKHLFAGAITGIRNPRAHEPDTKDSPTVAIELLTFANHLMRKLEAATKADGETGHDSFRQTQRVQPRRGARPRAAGAAGVGLRPREALAAERSDERRCC